MEDYVREAEKYDAAVAGELVSGWKDDMDALLVFVCFFAHF